MLDDVGGRVDDAGDDDLIVGQPGLTEHAIFVGVPAGRERQHEAADVGLPQQREDLGQRHVAVVRALVVAPADMQPHALARHGGERVVDGRHHPLDETEEFGQRAILEREVSLQREVRTIELQQEAARDDRLVFDPQRRAERRQVGIPGVVVLVLHGAGEQAGRGRGHEGRPGEGAVTKASTKPS